MTRRRFARFNDNFARDRDRNSRSRTCESSYRTRRIEFNLIKIFASRRNEGSFEASCNIAPLAKGLARLRVSNANGNAAINFVERLRTRDKRARSDARVSESIS